MPDFGVCPRLLHLLMVAVALRIISQQRNSLVAFGGEPALMQQVCMPAAC
jgi:hypothetical protein